MLKKSFIFALICILTACGQAESLGTDQHGVPIPTALVAEHWLVINYWAVWCGPCRKEVPELNALHHALHSQGVRVFGVNYDQLEGEALLADSQQLGIEFPVLSADPATHFNLPETHGLPATYIINRQGELVGQLRGEQTQQSILDALRQAGWSAP